MSSEENRRKAMHGQGARRSLASALGALKDNGSIVNWRSRPSWGYLEYDSSQFKATEEITLSSGKKMILFSTNSIRSDRVKENQWDASNIKAIDPSVEEALVVVPDEKALDGGRSFRNRLTSGKLFTAIDDIVTVEGLYSLITVEHSSAMGAGLRHDFEGRDFEGTLAAILSDVDNLARFNGDPLSVGYRYDVFLEAMSAFGILSDEAYKITATTDIPKLPTGGSPKTDVAATFFLRTGEYRLVTISVKNTSQSSVSVHEFTANVFAAVLNASDSRLRELLNKFQSAGSASAMGEGQAEALREVLKPYHKRLDKWVFSGEGTPGATELQCAKFLAVRDKSDGSVSFHEIDAYIDALEAANDGARGFGTIFSWTYPSKKRGKSIQLKAPIVK